MASKLVMWLAQKGIEDVKLKAYKCPADKWTIGIGNTYYEDGSPVKPGDVITLERAYKLAENLAIVYSDHVKKTVKRQLTENQFIALSSLCYNIGTGAKSKTKGFSNSKVLAMLNAGESVNDIAKVFAVSFITANGIPNAGVKNRREREAALFLKP